MVTTTVSGTPNINIRHDSALSKRDEVLLDAETVESTILEAHQQACPRTRRESSSWRHSRFSSHRPRLLIDFITTMALPAMRPRG